NRHDIQNGILTEEEAQEIMDHFVMKLRLVRFLIGDVFYE
ncbi:MAG: hypothetical protein K2K06_00960, partial [Oscillospiraceae bacterium]|nr:hypothetical protein [Oscillospiraceae bacterium]